MTISSEANLSILPEWSQFMSPVSVVCITGMLNQVVLRKLSRALNTSNLHGHMYCTNDICNWCR